MLAAVAVLWTHAASAAPLELYGKLPSVEAMAISPDGARLGFVLSDGAARRIGIKDLASNKISHLIDAGAIKVRDVMWAGSDHLIILSSTTSSVVELAGPRREYLLALDYNLTTRKLKPLLADADHALNAIYGVAVRIVDGKPALFVQGIHFEGSTGTLSVYRIDLERDTSKLIEVGGENTSDWLIGQDGKVTAQTTYKVGNGRWALKVKTANGWRESRVVQALEEPPALLGLGRDGHSVLVEEVQDEIETLREVTPEGAWGEPLNVADDSGFLFDPAGHNLIGYTSLVGEEQKYEFFNDHDRAVWAVVKKAYPDQRVQLISWSDDRQKLIALVDSPKNGPSYVLIDLSTHHADWVANQYAALTPDDISPVQTLKFKAQDGLALTGYLTTPRGVEAKSLPLVVFPHGGPAARDEPGFDWWAQAMASRGYAVLQVNYRGSAGFGLQFLDAGIGQWGRKMQTDLSDGVRYLAGQGIIDPKRVCIVGASYGGYAALAGAAFDSSVYRCAASVAGPSNMRSFVTWSRIQHSLASERYWVRFMGAEETKDSTLSEISPALHADRVTSPILLIHGKDDTIVPLAQSQAMADALKKAGQPVEFITLDSTDHWLTKGETRLAMLQAVMAFLEKNNPPR